jgi:hypothetical protein
VAQGKLKGHLPRLEPESYRGPAFVHWTLTIKTGPPAGSLLRFITIGRFACCTLALATALLVLPTS